MSTQENSAPEAEDQEECEELSDFDKGQVVAAHRIGMSVSETARMVGCSPAAVVSTLRQWRGERRPGEKELSSGEEQQQEEEEKKKGSRRRKKGKEARTEGGKKTRLGTGSVRLQEDG